MRRTDLIKHLLPGNEHKNFHDNPTNKHNAYDLRHLTVNLRVCGLKLRFNLQSSPVEGIFPQQDSNKNQLANSTHHRGPPLPSSFPL